MNHFRLQRLRGPFSLGLLVGAVVIFLLPAGCTEQKREVGSVADRQQESQAEAAVHLAALLADPALFAGREVVVTGKVAAGLAFEFVSEQPYLIESDGHQLWVVTSKVLPKEGGEITVRGIVAAPYQIKGRHYKVVLLESGGGP